MAIECVTIENNHNFSGNPILEQHRLRFRAIIERQNWQVPTIGDLEYDQYDNPSTVYLIWRDNQGVARGVSRLCRTDRPFMLKDFFSHTVTYQDIPQGDNVLEGSRFCIDNMLSLEQRKKIIQEIIIAYLEYGISVGATKIIGIMYPIYWNNIFTKNGWNPVWIGDLITTPEGKKSRAAILEVNHKVLENVRKKTGILSSVISDLNIVYHKENIYAK